MEPEPEQFDISPAEMSAIMALIQLAKGVKINYLYVIR